jgi:hypothetical protein
VKKNKKDKGKEESEAGGIVSSATRDEAQHNTGNTTVKAQGKGMTTTTTTTRKEDKED